MDEQSRKVSATAIFTILIMLGALVFWLVDWLDVSRLIWEMKKAIG